MSRISCGSTCLGSAYTALFQPSVFPLITSLSSGCPSQAWNANQPGDDLLCGIITSDCRTCETYARESKHAVKNWGLYWWLGVDVLSSFSIVAMNCGVGPVVSGTTASDGVVGRGSWLSSQFFTPDLKPWGCRTVAVWSTLDFIAEAMR